MKTLIKFRLLFLILLLNFLFFNSAQAQIVWTCGFEVADGVSATSGTACLSTASGIINTNCVPTGWVTGGTVAAERRRWSATGQIVRSGDLAMKFITDPAAPNKGWLVTQGAVLTAGTVYTLEFYYRIHANASTATFKIDVGVTTSQTAVSGLTMTTVVNSNDQDTYVPVSYNFTPNTTGTYYFALMGTAPGVAASHDKKGINIDDMTLSYVVPPCVVPSALTYTSNAPNYCVGTAITSNSPTVTGTAPTYTVTPALPAGLSLNASTGVISGTPTAAATGNYTITATNSCGSVNKVINIRVTDLIAEAGPSKSINCAGSVILDGVAVADGNSTILSQDFENGMNGWTRQNLTTGGTPANADWTILPSTPLWGGGVASGSNFILSNSGFNGNGVVGGGTPSNINSGDNILRSPAFSTMGFSTLELSFRHFFMQTDANSSINVEVSTNGTTWSAPLFTTWNTQGANQNFALKLINLNAYINQPVLYIRFRYNMSSDYFWAIDDIVVNGVLPPTYTWSPATGLSATNVINPTASPTATTVYTLTVTSNGCTASDNVTVTVNNTIVAPSAVAIPATQCAGSATTLTASGGSTGDPGVTTQWFTGSCGGTPAGTGASINVSPSVTTTYYVRNINACHQSSCFTQVVTVTPVVTPSVTISGAPASSICSGTSVTFTANPTNGGAAPTYQWQLNGADIPSATGTTYTSTTLNDGDVVSVTMISNDPCASSTAVSATSPATIQVGSSVTPSVAISGAPASSICSGTSVTLTANPTNGGTTPTYQWQVNGVDVSGETGTTYTSTTLNDGDVVSVTMVSNDPCASATAVSATTPATIQVGTSVTPSVAISGAPASSICSGTSVTFTANPTNGGAAPTYQWQLNGVDVSGATGANYTSTSLNDGDVVSVSMVSNDPCASSTAVSATTPATIDVTPALTPSVTISGAPASSICSGTSVTFTANPVNGGSAPTYQWLLNGTNISGATGSTYSSTTLNNGDVISVSMVSNDPCAPATAVSATTPATIPVTSAPVPSVTISGAPSSSICSGTSITFTANPVNGGASPTYQWQLNGANIAGATSSTYTSTTLSNGDIVSVSMVSNNPCAPATPVSATAPVTIQVTASPVPSVSMTGGPNATMCAGTSVTFTANPINGGTAPTFQWQLNGVNIPGATGTTYTTSTLNTGDVISVSMISNLPCAPATAVSTSALGFVVNPAMNIAISSTNVGCGGQNNGTATVTVSAGTPGYTYSWLPSGGNAAVASNLGAGSYTATVTDAAGCVQTANVTVGSSASIALSTTSTPVNCGSKDGTATATVTGGTGNFTYLWMPGSLTTASISNLSVGMYSVTVTDANGCSTSNNQLVGQNGSLGLTLDPYSAIIEEGESVNLEATYAPAIPGTIYTWSPPAGLSCTSCPNPVATPSQTTVYTVRVTTPDGCTQDTSSTITVKLKCGELFIPTIFSPNGDGVNDEFKILGKCVSAMSLKIYDRWGEMVFESTEQSYGWDGVYKGRIMNSAAFVYVVDINFADGRSVHEKGGMTLVR